MGTRSTIKFVEKYNNEERPLVNIYQQCDGYIDGVGYELARWLLGKTIINGFNTNKYTMLDYANGPCCLAAQFIKHFKTDIGGLYIVPMDNCQDYNYKVVIDNKDRITISVTHWDETEPFFIGTPESLLVYKECYDED